MSVTDRRDERDQSGVDDHPREFRKVLLEGDRLVELTDDGDRFEELVDRLQLRLNSLRERLGVSVL